MGLRIFLAVEGEEVGDDRDRLDLGLNLLEVGGEI